MNYHLAQVNIGRMLAPMDSSVMADFKANLDPINALAESAPGFLWRLKDDSNNATSIKVYDDDMIIVNMSVWRDMESLSQFVYQSKHTDYFRRRKEWFEKMKEHHMAMWWLPADQFPTVQQAANRLEYLRKHGETPHAFTFRSKHSAADSLKYHPVH